MSDSPFKYDVDQTNFEALVLAKSMECLVVVDFWASWCGPCQMLMPVLEKLADDYQGKFVLAKVNSDEQQALASYFGVRSLPTVKFFKQGQIVHEFMGAQTEPAIRQMLDQFIMREADQIHQQADVLIASGDYEAAITLLHKALEQDPDNAQLRFAIINTCLLNQDYATARHWFDSLPSNEALSDLGQQIKVKLEFAENLSDIPSLTEAEQRLANDPSDAEGLYAKAIWSYQQNDYPLAFDNLLELLKKHPGYRDGIAKATLLQFFTLLSDHAEMVSEYRRKMARLLY